MSLGIQTNFASLSAQNQLQKTNKGYEQALTRLSSGLRINSAKDDAAGQAIASRFTSQMQGYSQGTRNAADAISLAQTAEGAMNELINNVQRIRELMVQVQLTTVTAADQLAIGTELVTLEEEIIRVQDTKYNGQAIIGSNARTFAFQVGPDSGNTVDIKTTDIASLPDYFGLTEHAAIGTGTYDPTSMISKADSFLASINLERAKLGAAQNRFESIIILNDTFYTNLATARGRIRDTNFAEETANLTKTQILQQAGISVISQANLMPQYVLSLLA